ncbi:hypothetical protein CDG77_02210 [Nostoc sp. 'Peltigera membranacea cyanobiont' 213]|uniref:hypothetical protein n=1 Tax=Nostoc sp. 'Peltigera membranacea cyanobiont' 213 TaxID=2014530 RepID=UPI000B9511E5|nr:hypothetical protein [Nostoc sp. 'Peltigera membranacea cyanobiont' 213]OYD99291.1 hypothetical protein CDG77_02210 [Nostoc sp. 'Peltigera membranacea cyanobiont' 213]
MFFGQIERECLYGENWTISQPAKLPDHLQLLVDKEEVKCDIWELQSQELENQAIHQNFERDSSQL